jgi:hypothetical protein
VTVGAALGSLFAHTHNYPGRMSIHMVPFAIALSVVAAATAFKWRAAWGTRTATQVPV